MPRLMRIQANLPYLTGRKLIEKKRKDGFGDKTWEEYFTYLSKDIHLKLRQRDIISENTAKLLDIWMQNLADNLPYIRFGDKTSMIINDYSANNLRELAEPTYPTEKKPPKSSAVVIGRGPSIFKHKHLELLAEAISSGYDGIICCTDGMLIECLKHNIIPHITTTVDGSPIIQKWYNHHLVKKHGPKINVALNATTHHDVYLICRDSGCKVYWFSSTYDDWRNIQSFTKIQRLLTKSKFVKKSLQTIACGGNTGFTAWVMATDLFKRSPVGLIGMDFGYPKGTKLEDTPYFSGIMNTANGDPKIIPHVYQEIYHPEFKTKAMIDPVFREYRDSFIVANRQMPPWFHHYGGTINCTEGGTLFGPAITCMTLKAFLSKYNT